MSMPNGHISAEMLDYAIKSVNRMNDIKKNKEMAHDLIPESLFQVNMLFIPGQIGEHTVNMFVDTGAQITIMTEECATRCGLEHLIDYTYQGKAVGVGEQEFIGKIWCAEVIIGVHSVPCSFVILKKMGDDIIFGLDMMTAHGCVLDLVNKQLCLGPSKIKFVVPDNKDVNKKLKVQEQTENLNFLLDIPDLDIPPDAEKSK